MPTVDLSLGDINFAIDPDLNLDCDIPGAVPVLLEDMVHTDTETWVPLSGVPTAAGAFAGSVQMTAPAVVPLVIPGDIDPESPTISTGLAATRFLFQRPRLRFRAPHRGYGPPERYFIPVDYSGGWTTDPPISVELTTALGDGNIQYVYLDPTLYRRAELYDVGSLLWPNAYYPQSFYVYDGARGVLKRYALCYVTKHGVMCLRQSGTTTYSQVTFGFTAVLHPGSSKHYTVFETTGADKTHFLQVRYAHGRLSVIYNNREVAAHECFKGSAEPVVILLALDTVADEGRLFVHDRSRSSRTFQAQGIVGLPLSGSIGAARNRAIFPVEGYQDFARMDLLEVDIWPTALSFPQMEQKAALLAAAYGVSL